MSDIILVKDTVEIKREVKTIMVPDYTPDFEQVELLKDAVQTAHDESIKTINVMTDSILEQIGTYLYELCRPVLEYYSVKKLPLPDDLKWSNSPWHFRPTASSNCGLDLSGFYYHDYIQIYITLSGYKIDCEDPEGRMITSLASYWPDFKNHTQNNIKYIIKQLKDTEETKLATYAQRTKTLNDFEL